MYTHNNINMIIMIAYLSVVKLSVHINLSFSDVASQIRNRMGDVCRIW